MPLYTTLPRNCLLPIMTKKKKKLMDCYQILGKWTVETVDTF